MVTTILFHDSLGFEPGEVAREEETSKVRSFLATVPEYMFRRRVRIDVENVLQRASFLRHHPQQLQRGF